MLSIGVAFAGPPPAAIEYHRLAAGFVPEAKNAAGLATGYARFNPWGEYTAYLLLTNAEGQRTWRIEQYQQVPGVDFWQGSSMYLLEGNNRALLIDTGQRSKGATPGVNDLKSVVRQLLGHENDGTKRAHPIDFVVANTHDHADHVGENARMGDRSVYFMDGDWPADAPANYIPIREGGGATTHGQGTAVPDIDLGGRRLAAVAIPPHTPGSTGYLDAANGMLFSGDAVGSGWPWLHWAAIADYATAMDHLAALTRDIPGLAVLPAHFYQVDAFDRRDGPLGYQYLLDQRASAHGIVDGTVEGVPYFDAGPAVYWGGVGSARLTYSLSRVDAPGTPPRTNYRSVRISGPSWRREWIRKPEQAALLGIQGELHLIRSASGAILYMLNGSRTALLIGSGSGEPGLAEIVAHLAGGRSLQVITLNRDPAQVGGLSMLPHDAYIAAATSSILDLGTDGAGHALRVEVHALGNDRFTLLSIRDRILFTSDVEHLDTAPPEWHEATDGRFDLVYSGNRDEWFTAPPGLTATSK
jgi:glyoxylase-like metal-dependent hydrolase (beta-lactamase superfamily II)